MRHASNPVGRYGTEAFAVGFLNAAPTPRSNVIRCRSVAAVEIVSSRFSKVLFASSIRACHAYQSAGIGFIQLRGLPTDGANVSSRRQRVFPRAPTEQKPSSPGEHRRPTVHAADHRIPLMANVEHRPETVRSRAIFQAMHASVSARYRSVRLISRASNSLGPVHGAQCLLIAFCQTAHGVEHGGCRGRLLYLTTSHSALRCP